MADLTNTNPFTLEGIIPLAERIKALSKNEGKKIIAYIYDAPDYGTYRYRVYNMCQILNKSEDYFGVYFFLREIADITPYYKHFDAVVFCRDPWTYEMDMFIQKLKSENIPLVYDVDDLVFDPQKAPILLNYLKVPPEHEDWWFSYVSKRYVIAKHCTSFISTNTLLTQKLEDVFGSDANYFVLPNTLNDEQVEVSEPLYEAKLGKQKDTDDPFIIGYFSGTGTHNNDFKIVANELADILEKYPNVKLQIVGFLDLPQELQKFENTDRIIRLPLMTFLELQECIANCDLNIIPLIKSQFTDTKSELKYFEAAVVGTPCIASPSYVYQQCITQGENGYLCRPGEWEKTIEIFIQNRNASKKITETAYKHAYANYYGNKTDNAVFDTLKIILGDKNKRIT